MRSGKRFLVASVGVCWAILVCLSGFACSSRRVSVGLPVEESPLVGLSPGAVFSSLPKDQTSTIRFERISAEDGLSQNAVLAILQDRQGFMWFGTEDGLNKYDGYGFTVFKHDPDDRLTLSDDFVSAIYEDRSGVLWVGTRSGLDHFDRVTRTFTHFEHDPNDPRSLGGKWVTAICEDHEGMLWVGTDDGGLDRLDRATNSFVHFRHDPGDLATLSDNRVAAIYEDQSGELWIGTDVGLNRFDQNGGYFWYIHSSWNQIVKKIGIG